MKSRRIDIFCPKCEWRPKPSSRWVCHPSCGHVWNTFDTGGICPACGTAWKDTQCLACDIFSPHRAWYHEAAGLGELLAAARTQTGHRRGPS